jgi:hypothetical protein
VAVIAGGTTLVSNNQWDSADAATFRDVGAFALPGGSRDAAVVMSLAAGAYSTPVGDGGGSGIALLEIYDAQASSTAAALVNASTRAYVGTGDAVLIPGFAFAGPGIVRLLVRAVGPTLGAFGVTDALGDPHLTLFSGSAVIGANDNWGGAANATDIATAAGQVGAFALPSGSPDAALLVTLSAGAYTATVSGAGGTTGTALVEIYVVP